MVAFIDKYDLDGIEVDWETAVTLPLHEVFVREIREKLNVLESRKGRKMYLTTALHSWQRYSKELAGKVSRSLDWINIMTYDMGGGIWGNVPTHNTPLDRIITDLKAWEMKETIRTKAEWVKENGFRGAFWWEFSYDEILPDSKDGKIRHHLIDEIKW